MTARGGTLRIGVLHPVHGVGTDTLPEKSIGAFGRLISKPGGSANLPFLAAADSSLPEHREQNCTKVWALLSLPVCYAGSICVALPVEGTTSPSESPVSRQSAAVS